MDAVYFDTPDLRLLRSGITLRRREGGPDAGWHLKLPAGEDARQEIRAQLGKSDRPPSELAELVAGVVRGAPLTPAASISTRRHRLQLLGRRGNVLAEVTDDLVSGQPTGRQSPTTWREIEVELAEQTDSDLLDRVETRLLRSGLSRAPFGSKLRRVLDLDRPRPAGPSKKATAGQAVLSYLRDQVEAINRQDILVRRGADDAIHQLRVAARRIRSTLRVFGKLMDAQRAQRLERDLRWLGRKLGPARDLEMLEQRIRTAVADLPDELVLGDVNTRLTRHFTPARASADRVALRTLNTTRYFRLRDQLDGLLTAAPMKRRARRRARKELPRHVRRAYRKVARRMHTVATTPPGPTRDDAIHSVRKAAKRLRYATECATPPVGKPARRTRKRAKAFTQTLGAYQDAVVARPVLRQLSITAYQAGDNAFTFGLLAGDSHTTGEIVDAWKRLHTSKVRSWLRV